MCVVMERRECVAKGGTKTMRWFILIPAIIFFVLFFVSGVVGGVNEDELEDDFFQPHP